MENLWTNVGIRVDNTSIKMLCIRKMSSQNINLNNQRITRKDSSESHWDIAKERERESVCVCVCKEKEIADLCASVFVWKVGELWMAQITIWRKPKMMEETQMTF